jgi:hypothetical protein
VAGAGAADIASGKGGGGAASYNTLVTVRNGP